jgi:hypothetical protein
MAVLGQITLNEISIYEIDALPYTAGNGFSAPIGSLAIMTDGSGIFQKIGASDLGWRATHFDSYWIQYTSNANFSTASSAFQNVPLNTDVFSNIGTYFTKVNATDFRCNFTGSIRASLSVSARPTGTNDRGWEACVTLNGTAVGISRTQGWGKTVFSRSGSGSSSCLINVATNDIIRLGFRSPESTTVETPSGYATLNLEVKRVIL